MGDVEELIKEIAVKHGISVGRDDPILILQTINKRLLEDSAKAQQEILDHYKEEMETLAKRWGDDARAKAERVLNAALTASRDMMVKAAKDGATTLAATVKKEVRTELVKIYEPVRDAKWLLVANVITAVMTLVAAILVFWAAQR